MILAIATTDWFGSYAAAAALLSLMFFMWPFALWAGSRFRQVGDPSERLGGKRAIGWLLLANVVVLVTAPLGSSMGRAWTWAVPAVGNPIFYLQHESLAIALELVPFLAAAWFVHGLALVGMNGRLRRVERVRGGLLVILALGQNVASFLVVGLLIYAYLPPSMGDYSGISTQAELQGRTAGQGGRIWFVPPVGGQLKSAAIGGGDERVEWPGPAPADAESIWRTADGERAVLVGRSEIVIVHLGSGQATRHPAGTGEQRPPATPPRTRPEVSQVTGIAAAELQPAHVFHPPDFRVAPQWMHEPGGVADAALRDVRRNWLAGNGLALELPEVQAHPAWLRMQSIQRLDSSGWLVANYGQTLIVLSPKEGWLAPAGVRAGAFAVFSEPGPSTRPAD